MLVVANLVHAIQQMDQMDQMVGEMGQINNEESIIQKINNAVEIKFVVDFRRKMVSQMSFSKLLLFRKKKVTN